MSRGAALVEQLDAITRDGLVLAPETVAAIGAGRGAAQPLDRGRAVGDRGAAGLGGVAAGALTAAAVGGQSETCPLIIFFTITSRALGQWRP